MDSLRKIILIQLETKIKVRDIVLIIWDYYYDSDDYKIDIEYCATQHMTRDNNHTKYYCAANDNGYYYTKEIINNCDNMDTNCNQIEIFYVSYKNINKIEKWIVPYKHECFEILGITTYRDKIILVIDKKILICDSDFKNIKTIKFKNHFLDKYWLIDGNIEATDEHLIMHFYSYCGYGKKYYTRYYDMKYILTNKKYKMRRPLLIENKNRKVELKIIEKNTDAYLSERTSDCIYNYCMRYNDICMPRSKQNIYIKNNLVNLPKPTEDIDAILITNNYIIVVNEHVRYRKTSQVNLQRYEITSIWWIDVYKIKYYI